ncbi:MAG TPA: TM0106 family RecB-like putative nuclease, partial [Blastocatellia bacterium]|nr:TM0106 family RecB-like putative nuclease [Blastocatellia bacterium]
MFSATDISDFLACKHLTNLERAREAGEISRPFFADPGGDLIKALGLRHEQACLSRLIDSGIDVVEIPSDLSRSKAVARTKEEMQRGAAAIYQATFQEGQWIGRADFLVRVDKPSALGFWSYEVIETKLARSTKARALIQLCFYSDLLSRIQGLEPEWMHVVLGGRIPSEDFQVKRYLAYFRQVRRQYEKAIGSPATTYPEPVEHCRVCRWSPVCDERRRTDDHLSLVAGISSNQRKALVERGIGTMAGLADLALPPEPAVERIGQSALQKIHDQADIQVRGRRDNRHLYEFLEPVEAEKGLAALPLPSRGDIFLDFEGAPYAFEGGLEYLVGTIMLSDDHEPIPVYGAAWAFDPAGEKAAFENFIDTVMDRWDRYPDLHVYHYAPYEPTALKRLAGRHSTRVEQVDRMLRAGLFVDLFHVVRQGLRASVESYSIKKLEPLYGFRRETALTEATAALQAFEAALVLEGSQDEIRQLTPAIESYNRDDCISAFELRYWLESLRAELEARSGQPIPRLAPKTGAPTEDLAGQIERVAAIYASLTRDLPAETIAWTPDEQATWLLAQLLDWHRREEKSAWWEYFRLCELTDEELERDKNAMGGLVYVGEVDKVKKSIIHRYRFRRQDHSIDRAHTVHDPRTQNGVGEVAAIDERDCTIDIKRSANSTIPHPTALIPLDVISSGALRDSILRLGSWVAEHGIVAPGRFQAARDLLLARAPRLREVELKSVVGRHPNIVDAARELAVSIDSSILPVQGPPGSGKTYIGARMIV